MSGYQVYQFQSVDRPLTEKERKTIGSWSSRTYPTTTSATFSYSYGDFPMQVEQVLADYFDAFLYFDSWGQKRLMFRIPKKLVDRKAIRQFEIDGSGSYSTELSVYSKKSYYLFDFDWNEEEGGGWFEEDDYSIGDMLVLREDIIKGDYRSLYLFWMKLASEKENLEIDDEEYDEEFGEEEGEYIPSVPPNLQKLSASLKAFIEFFEIDKDLVKAAQEASPEIETSSVDYKKLILQLSDKERIDYLFRLVNGEANLDLQIKKRLEKLQNSGKESLSTKELRLSIQELKNRQKVEENKRIESEKKAAAEAHHQKMLTLAKEEHIHWRTVVYNLDRKTGKSYDIATEVLEDLRYLAVFQDKLEEFKEKMAEVREKYGRSQALLKRFSKAKLP